MGPKRGTIISDSAALAKAQRVEVGIDSMGPKRGPSISAQQLLQKAQRLLRWIWMGLVFMLSYARVVP